jgi:hypothetical protein
VKVKIYLSDEVRHYEFIRTGRQFIPTGREYGHPFTFEVPTEEISMEARKELSRLYSYFDTYPSGPFGLLGDSHDDSVLLGKGNNMPGVLEEYSGYPAWQAPFVPMNAYEWDILILDYAQHRRQYEQQALYALIEKLRHPREHFPNTLRSRIVSQSFVGLDGFEEAVKLAEAAGAVFEEQGREFVRSYGGYDEDEAET